MPRNVIVFNIKISRQKLDYPSHARSLVPRAASCNVPVKQRLILSLAHHDVCQETMIRDLVLSSHQIVCMAATATLHVTLINVLWGCPIVDIPDWLSLRNHWETTQNFANLCNSAKIDLKHLIEVLTCCFPGSTHGMYTVVCKRFATAGPQICFLVRLNVLSSMR